MAVCEQCEREVEAGDVVYERSDHRNVHTFCSPQHRTLWLNREPEPAAKEPEPEPEPEPDEEPKPAKQPAAPPAKRGRPRKNAAKS